MKKIIKLWKSFLKELRETSKNCPRETKW